MLALRNPVQRYDWGSPDRLATFLGERPDGRPQAELWIGAHPSAPSLARLDPAEVGRGGTDGDDTWLPLDQLIAGDPLRWVGAEVLERFGPTLPFLFKVLAAAEPLSLQLHPDLVAARAGFAGENAAGVALADPARRYRDPNHKPELLVALDGFEVLSGFRPVSEIADVFRAFDLPPAWVELAATLEPGDLCARLWQLEPLDASVLVRTALRSAGAVRNDQAGDGQADDDEAGDEVGAGGGVGVGVGGGAPGGATPVGRGGRSGSSSQTALFPAECDFVRRAAACHPGDIGVVVGLCLNRASLRPGEGAFAEPGVLHSYLGGFGLEIMANSDNVLRGGLTTKVVDVSELRRHLVGHSTTPRRLIAHPHRLGGGREQRFDVLVDEFALSSLHPSPHGQTMVVRAGGPEILLCVQGEVWVTSHPSDPSDPSDPPDLSDAPERAGGTAHGQVPSTPERPSTPMALRQGQAAFVPAAGPGTYGVSGAGVLYRAQVGIHARRLWAD